MRLHRYLLPLGLILIGAGLRVYRLDFRALWWDEGLSLTFARLSLQENAWLAVQLADTNPPVYRLLLGGWLELVGWSAFTARLFSAVAGIILLAMVYRLARDLRFPHPAALIALALAAASPMLVYHSQEAKGYSLVALAGTASVVFWLRLHGPPALNARGANAGGASRWMARRGRAGLWLAWGLSLWIALGSHYIAAFLIAVENLWSVALTWRARRAGTGGWVRHWAWQLGIQAGVALALLPFVILTFGRTGAVVRNELGAATGLATPAQFLAQHLLEMASGPRAGSSAAAAVVGAWLVAGWRPKAREWGLLLWIGVPLALGLALNSAHEFFFPRFLLYTVPAVLLLAAVGMQRLARLAPGVPVGVACLAQVAVCLGLWWPALRAQYTAPSDPAEDWRPAAAGLRPLLRPGDAAIFVWGWIPGYLDAYLGPAPRPDYALGYFTPESLDAEMAGLLRGQSRLWLLDSYVDHLDVRNMAGRWLGERSALVYDQWFGNAHLALFVVAPTPNAAHGTVAAEFKNGLRLTAPRVHLEAAPGDALAIPLDWQTVQPVAGRATVFLHALAPDGSLAFGHDSEPRNGLAPVEGWPAGAVMTELRGAFVPPQLPPGDYTLQIGLYDTVTHVPIEPGPITLGVIEVSPAP